MERIRQPTFETGLVAKPEVESTKPEKLPKRKNSLLIKFADVIAALGYVGGTVYLGFRHKDFSDATVAAISYTVATTALAISLEERRLANSR